MYLGVSHTSHPKRVEFKGNPILEVLLYLCLHPLTHNDQIWHGVTYGEGRVFRRSAICTNASRGLSPTAEFVVLLASCRTICRLSLFERYCVECTQHYLVYMNHVLTYIKGLAMSFLSTIILIFIYNFASNFTLTLFSNFCYVRKHAVQ